ncbi:unnamed protein product [Gordionus sp. m RMFG-2023]|uniref:kelch-like protein 10 n=1 Tax=Gordionus sp. m RMFG-2023 TaxID=3053472 RepID=UPI0030DFD5D1
MEENVDVKFDEIIGESFIDIKENGNFSDVIIETENGVEYKAHKAVLATISPIFKAIFQENKPNHQGSQVMRIIFKSVPSSIMEIFINYAYNYQLEIDFYNVEVLLCYADEYHVFGVLKLCCDYLIDNLHTHNALGIHSLVKKYNLPCTEELIRKYVLSRFVEIAIGSQEFLQLNEDDLCKFLSDDALNIKSEEKTFDLLIKWIKVSPKQRRKCISRLIKCIRLGLLSFDYCANTLSHNEYYIEAMNSDLSKNYLLDAQSYVKESENQMLNDVGFNFSYARPRIPHEIIFAMGGWSTGNTTNFMETYDSRSDRWFICTSNPTTSRPAYHGMVFLNGFIYVIGGYDGTDYFSTVQSFDPETEEWKLVAPMHKPRCYVSVACYNGRIYAIGGYNGVQRMASGEKYNPINNQWTMLPKDMHRQRSDACAATIKNKIFMVGGFNGEEITNTAEYLDTDLEQWIEIRPMLSPRTGVRCVSHNNILYVVGGFNGTNRLNSGEYYNLEKGDWVEIPNMLCPRSNFMLIQMEGFLYAIGGFNGNTTISLVESYDCENKEWITCCNMNIRRSALGACVAYGLSNSKYYTFHGQIGIGDLNKDTNEVELD